MAASRNPFDYKPAQVAKALAATGTSVVALCGALNAALTSGGLTAAGAWIASVAAVITPVVVFLKRAESVSDVLDSSDGG